jgi:hypothetical protein
LRSLVCGLRTLVSPLVIVAKTKPAIPNIKSEFLFIVKFITSILRPRLLYAISFLYSIQVPPNYNKYDASSD